MLEAISIQEASSCIDIGYICMVSCAFFNEECIDIVTHSNFMIKFPSNISQVLWPI